MLKQEGTYIPGQGTQTVAIHSLHSRHANERHAKGIREAIVGTCNNRGDNAGFRSLLQQPVLEYIAVCCHPTAAVSQLNCNNCSDTVIILGRFAGHDVVVHDF